MKAQRQTKFKRFLYRHKVHMNHRRLFDVIICRDPWWHWGHRMMALTGSDFGGSWSEPEPPTWYYRPIDRRRGKFEVIKDYEEFQRATDGVPEADVIDNWNAICVDQDGDLQLGKRYWGGAFYRMDKSEVKLLRRYLRMWHRLDWWGLRSYLYFAGLHNAVHRRKPFSCKQAPPAGSGGYSHWYCEETRRHDGPHRFQNYTWLDGQVEFTQR